MVTARTSMEPQLTRSPRQMYAASAFASLGIGFGAAALGFFGITGPRSSFARTNTALAIACAGIALSLRATARPMPTIASNPRPELHDQNKADPIDYSIIIPVYNRPEQLRTLLRSLSEIGVASSDLGTGEIIVVDDGSTDDTAVVAQNLALEMSIPTRIVSQKNGGTSSARNTGFATARGTIGISIDSDCIPEATWLASMLDAARSDPKLLVFARIRRKKRPAYPLENMPDCKGFVSASFAMNRASYLKLGGFYEPYVATHDDRDLVLTALAAGYNVAHAADGWITHPLRRETIRSIWHVGLNSKYGNLFAMRHGENAARDVRPTPYYFFGVGSNYGSSIAFVVTGANLVLAAYFFMSRPTKRFRLLRDGSKAAFVLFGAYIACLTTLGTITRARLKDIPMYVATLGTFQVGTLIGRLKGTLEYGIFLL
jgi:glycosyltransferase involved in cell wall biosynthesis